MPAKKKVIPKTDSEIPPVEASESANALNQKKSDVEVFKAFGSSQNIEGYWFNPFCVIRKGSTKRVRGKDVDAIDFLQKSPFYGKIFAMVGDERYKHKITNKKQPKKEKYTREELLQLCTDQDIQPQSSWTELDFYKNIFGIGEDKK